MNKTVFAIVLFFLNISIVNGQVRFEETNNLSSRITNKKDRTITIINKNVVKQKHSENRKSNIEKVVISVSNSTIIYGAENLSNVKIVYLEKNKQHPQKTKSKVLVAKRLVKKNLPQTPKALHLQLTAPTSSEVFKNILARKSEMFSSSHSFNLATYKIFSINIGKILVLKEFNKNYKNPLLSLHYFGEQYFTRPPTSI
ncbi:hypothetical protein G6R40_06290 [Chryseobacterium sp. POL2]|uniref:hypothetical protein n=1 Tax=Chryseobacterium sp. POL2 TaxID=2713414 RepID=UPI0013E12AB8|nr:hypothetical protein [Chryseobacterium sp. POL2]QIG89312.1 hypothetical protein G6R40_06290 [Chryseobacterium sp. POL2]